MRRHGSTTLTAAASICQNPTWEALRLAAHRRNFFGGRDQAAQRLGSRNREGHVPEVDVLIREFHADVGLAVTRMPDGDDLAFHLFAGALVFQLQSLAQNDA